MEILFWILLALSVYCYFGYPLGLFLCARYKTAAVAKKDITPSVSVVFSVWNEEDVIRRKLENFCSLNYPANKMEILVASDGSTDRTNSIIREIKDPRIKLFESAERCGKMAMINRLVEAAAGEVVVLTDARQTFAPEAIKELVANFSDPLVGCASGELMFSDGEGATAKGINLYWDYEKFIRSLESRLHSMLGATGAIYAIRKSLFSPVPEDVVLDDVYIPFKIISKGYRAIFDESAKAYDEVADSPREEHRRKARTLYGNYQIFALFPGMFNVFKSPIAVQLFSHKLLRVLIPFFLIALFFVNAALCANAMYQRLMVLQSMFYFMAAVGALVRHQKTGPLRILSRVCYVPYVFCLLNFSALTGFFRFTQRSQKAAWEKARG